MRRTRFLTALGAIGAVAAATLAMVPVTAAPPEPTVSLVPVGTHRTGIFDNSAAEIVAHDPVSQRLFVVNFALDRVDILDLSDPTSPTFIKSLDLGGSPNSVDVHNGLIAVAVDASPKTDPGSVVFMDFDGNELKRVTVGSLPDMLTFTPDGSKVVVANEGEPGAGLEGDLPSYLDAADPDGSISIIDVSNGVGSATVTPATFTSFNDSRAALVAAGVRLNPAIPTVAQDLEPEYLTVSADSTTAWVGLQENNAIAEVDLISGVVTRITALGRIDRSVAGHGFDPSDRDPEGNPTFGLRTYAHVFGIRMPDAIASFEVSGITYLVTANEGDAREYTDLTDVSRAKDLRDVVARYTGAPRPTRARALCAAEFDDPETTLDERETLIGDGELGRLNVSTIDGYDAGRGCFSSLHALGGRSFSIFTTDGTLVFDSGEDFERITYEHNPDFVNASHTDNGREGRSDDKGPESEGITVANLFGRTYAMLTFERIGGVITYDVSDPAHPVFVNYTNNRNFSEAPSLLVEDENGNETAVTNPLAGDLGPEGIISIPAADSPNGRALVVTANEVSGTTTIFEVVRTQPVPPPCSSLGPGQKGRPGPPVVCDQPFPQTRP